MPSTLAAKLHRGTWIEEEERTKAEQKRRARTLPIIVPLLADWAERVLLPWHVACGGRLCCAAQHTVFIQATLPWTEPMSCHGRCAPEWMKLRILALDSKEFS